MCASKIYTFALFAMCFALLTPHNTFAADQKCLSDYSKLGHATKFLTGPSPFDAREIKNPGEFFLEQARKRMVEEWSKMHRHFSAEEGSIIWGLDYVFMHKIEFVYLEADDPRLILKAGEPPRTAVTSSDFGPIYFNKAVINDPEKFGYAEAMSLLIHEYGHKIYKDVINSFGSREAYQNAVDKLAAKISQLSTRADQRIVIDDQSIYIHQSDIADNFMGVNGPQDRYNDPWWPVVTLSSKGKLYDINPPLFGALKAVNADVNSNDIYTGVVIRSVQEDSVPGQFVVSVTYQKNTKDNLARHQNRYLGEIPFEFSDLPGLPILARRMEEGVYPTDLKMSAAYKAIFVPKQKKLTITFFLDSPEALDINRGGEAVFIVNGKKRTLPILFPSEIKFPYNPMEQAHVIFENIDPALDKIEFLGLKMRVTKWPEMRTQFDSHFYPWDHYFVQPKEKSVIDLENSLGPK